MDDYKEEDYEDSNSTGDEWMDEEEMRREEEILRVCFFSFASLSLSPFFSTLSGFATS